MKINKSRLRNLEIICNIDRCFHNKWMHHMILPIFSPPSWCCPIINQTHASQWDMKMKQMTRRLRMTALYWVNLHTNMDEGKRNFHLFDSFTSPFSVGTLQVWPVESASEYQPMWSLPKTLRVRIFQAGDSLTFSAGRLKRCWWDSCQNLRRRHAILL